MIDVKTALGQNCYIIFDNTDQLKGFVTKNGINPFCGIVQGDVVLYCPESKGGDYVSAASTSSKSTPKYHHTELEDSRDMDPVTQVCKYVYDTFKEIVADIRERGVFTKPFEFNVNKHNDRNFSIYIVGNKLAGEEYYLDTWKTVPVVSCGIRTYSPMHPTMPGQLFVDLLVNYSGSWSSDYGDMKYVEDGTIKRHLQVAIETAIRDFTIQETI